MWTARTRTCDEGDARSRRTDSKHRLEEEQDEDHEKLGEELRLHERRNLRIFGLQKEEAEKSKTVREERVSQVIIVEQTSSS